MPNTTQTIVKNKGASIFRIIFGLFFVALGLFRHFAENVPADAGLFTIGIGLLFVVYGLYALFVGTKVTLQSASPEASDSASRLAVIQKMKNDGLISEQEFEAKRQEILKDL